MGLFLQISFALQVAHTDSAGGVAYSFSCSAACISVTPQQCSNPLNTEIFLGFKRDKSYLLPCLSVISTLSLPSSSQSTTFILGFYNGCQLFSPI